MKTKFLDEGPPPYSEQDKIWDAARETLPNSIPYRPKMIAVMGPTGTGKSTFISKLAGQEVKIGHNLSSCTQEIEEVPCKVGDEYVILVDTPGFNDTVRSDTEILTTLAEWMKASYDENMLLSGIIYLHSISDSRMTRASVQNLRMFRKLCGDDNLNHVILATTKWGITPHEDALRREHDLTSEEGFWSIMKAAGSLARRFENSTESATALVKEILSKDAKFVPKIQREIMQGKKLVDTEAGAELNGAFVKLQREHEKEKKALAEELERAKKDHDRAFQEALRKERERLDAKMAEQEAEQSRLHMTINEALQLRIRKLEESQQELMARDVGDDDDEGKQGWQVIVPKCGFRQENVY
ncbi:MAG: hypothetical protein LQ351_007933 [Letrouitia transgressa]|nr:MAG: hypothetical protein LQ351_007933 [Letrouitia transgressa]